MEDNDLEMKPATAPFPAITARATAESVQESTMQAHADAERSDRRAMIPLYIMLATSAAFTLVVLFGGVL